MSKKPKKEKKPKPGDQRSMYVDGVVLNGDYARAKQVVKLYRFLARAVDSQATLFDGAASHPIYQVKQVKKKGKVVAEYKSIQNFIDKDLSKLLGATFSTYMFKNGYKNKRQRERIGGNAPRYEYRDFWVQVTQDIAAAGGPSFDGRMWDSIRGQLVSIRGTKMPDYGKASREFLIDQEIFAPPKLENLGVKFVRADCCHRCWIINDERGWVVRLQYGNNEKEDYLELLVHGDVQVGDKVYTPRLDKYQLSRFRFLLKEVPGWSYQSITLNMRESRKKGPKFWLHIPFRKPERPKRERSSRVCEVTFRVVPGSELPKRKDDNSTDDDKTFVVHIDTGSWKSHIAVDGAVAWATRQQYNRRRLERERDCVRRMPKKFVRPIQETLAAMAEKRQNYTKHTNHNWSDRIARIAASADCGTIKFFNVPDNGLLLDGSISWPWSQLVALTTYKAKERGIDTVEVSDKSKKIIEEVLA